MSKLFETTNYKLNSTEIDKQFETFQDFVIKLIADYQGFEVVITDKGWSGQSLTFRMDTCMQDRTWGLEVEDNE
jgi:hypothetical protein